jgi:hypothetical protein
MQIRAIGFRSSSFRGSSRAGLVRELERRLGSTRTVAVCPASASSTTGPARRSTSAAPGRSRASAISRTRHRTLGRDDVVRAGHEPRRGVSQQFLVFDDGNGAALYAAGRFQLSGSPAILPVVRWDGASWSAVGASP